MQAAAVELHTAQEASDDRKYWGRNQKASEWDDKCIELLQKLWADEVSCSKIAVAMNEQFGTSFSRNAIIGKVHRLNLPMRGQSLEWKHMTDEEKATRKRKRDATFRERRRQSMTHARRINGPRLFLVEPPAVNDLEIPVDQRRQLMQLENCHCRWPVGEPGKTGFFFCGAPSADVALGRPYCAYHQFRSMGRAA